MEKYQNKYRIPSARLAGWDYANNAAYFITICTKYRIHFFGCIKNHKMVLSEMGKTAEAYWYEIPNQFPFVKLESFVVMPNHIHGIIVINKPIERWIPELKDSVPPAESISIGGFVGNKNPMLNENLSRIVRWSKGRCAFEIHKFHQEFNWQTRFHDHIIRNETEFNRINNYIKMNPKNWGMDKFSQPEK